MRLRKVKLQNFLSYGHLDFTFHQTSDDEPSIFVISGINNDVEASSDNSNGSGKSTLVGEAITFNLFGKNLRGSSRKVSLEDTVKFGENSMLNEAEYYIEDNVILDIRRETERGGRNTLEVTVDGQKKSKRLKRLSENDIKEFLGIDAEVYYQTISYYKDNTSILAMNYSQRLDFFKRLVNLSVMDTYYQRCKKYGVEIDKKLMAARAKKKSQQDILDAITSNDTKYRAIIQESIDNIQKEIDEQEKVPIQDENKYVDALLKIAEAVKTADREFHDLEQKKRRKNIEISDLEAEIKTFSRLKNTKCPTCQQ